MRLHYKNNLLQLYAAHIDAYPTPANLKYSWNMGSLSGLLLAGQIVTGVLLAMHYCPDTTLAFASVLHLTVDVPYGFVIRYFHMNGASLFFVAVYLHLFRNLYYNSGSQPREVLYISGIVILLLMVITAFIGYVLPWGQMSFWGATVITSLVSAVPVMGTALVYYLWGGFSVSNPTLNRFFSFHYLLPFVLAGLSLAHLAALHSYGSTNPLGVANAVKIPFGQYYVLKDVLGVLLTAFVFCALAFFYPEALNHSDNYIMANPYSTPAHIVPEWYFLPVYAILRSIPDKGIGILAVLLFFVGLLLQPFVSKGKAEPHLYSSFIAGLFILGWLGAKEITDITSLAGSVFTAYTFAYLFVLSPLYSFCSARIY
uniref:Cytochrome b n=1 Tax=Polytomella capuana TaxID=351368 RepID=B0YN30_9CHLO|nr:cytochrome b [Polytomella capuana]ABV56562.1 cytochrome b [Polytomella capuana]